MRKLSQKQETALLNIDSYGIRPENDELEELVRLEYLESDENDGWNISAIGREYLIQNKITTSI